MRSPSPFGWLLRKEWRELTSSPAWWALLILTGPLVGVSFAGGVSAFSELSVGAGAGCGAVCAPLVGIWGPTFGAYEVSAIFLLPFVAIRQLAGDRQSGALLIEMQSSVAPIARIGAKVLVLAAGWLVTGTAAVVAMGLWWRYGGNAYAPEIVVVSLGHLLNGVLTIGLGLAIAAMTDHPSTAAIVTLAVTIGTWVIDFAGAIQGGVWATLARYTPAAMVGTFQHGLVQANVLLIVVIGIGVAIATAGIWIQIGRSAATRARQTAAVILTAALAITAAAQVRASADLSESRQNSFSESEERALEQLSLPLEIDVHLSAQDPRRRQFERGPLAKLRRVVRDLDVRYVARTASGLFEQSDAGYGEIRYTLAGRTLATRVVTDEGALETIFDLAQTGAPAETEAPYMGHPFVGHATGAPLVFYGIWPALTIGAGFLTMKRRHA